METKPAPKLDDDARTFVVQRLACFEGPAAVVKAVKETFDVEITPQAVEAYDPTKRAGRSLSERWRTIFDTTRAAFLEDTASVGIAHKSFRLRKLDDMLATTMRQGNIALAMQLLAQAAKEMGGAYTNRRELTGKDGSRLVEDNHFVLEFVEPAWEEARAAVREIKATELH